MKPLIIALTLTLLLFLGVSYILVSEASADKEFYAKHGTLDAVDNLVAYRDKQCDGFVEAYKLVENAITYEEMDDAMRIWTVALDRCQGAVELISLYEKGL